MRYFILPLIFTAGLAAQTGPFSFGVKAGVPLTDALPGDSSPNYIVDTGRWTVGPTVELRLVGPLSLEFDALFQGYRTQSSYAYNESTYAGITYPGYYSTSRVDSKMWEIPVLLKYRFPGAKLRPFVDLGVEFAHTSSDVNGTQTCLGTADVCNTTGLNFSSQPQYKYTSTLTRRGPSGGAGVEFQYHKIKIAPEVRYAWLSVTKTDEVKILVGFTF
jgi:hypothetical protein